MWRVSEPSHDGRQGATPTRHSLQAVGCSQQLHPPRPVTSPAGLSGFSWRLRVKSPPATQETQVQSLGREDPLEEEMAAGSSILAWRIPVHRGHTKVTQSWTRLGD